MIREIIKAAKKSITIVDPYLNSSSTLKEIIKDINPAIELLLLTDSKNKKNFEIGLTITDNLNIKYMTPSQEKKIHDRFLIIDNSEYYHFGSSLNGITVSKVSSFRKIIGLNKIHELRNKLKEILAIS